MIINAMKEIGVTKEIPVQGENWLEHVEKLLEGEQGASLEDKIFARCITKVKQYEGLTEGEKKQKFKEIMKAFRYFGLISADSKVILLLMSLVQ
jgi:hypothetical protein